MRHTQPLTAEEQCVDAAIRARGGSHAHQDEALTRYRLGRSSSNCVTRDVNLSRVADLMLGEVPYDCAR